MFALLRKQNGKMKGFTLIELLVVIAIIGILAAIVLVSLNTARVRGRDARRVGDLASLAAALELYADTYGDYPGPATIDADVYTNFSNMIDDLQAAGLLATTPQDPQNTGNQRYAYGGPATTSATPCSPAPLGYIMRAALEADSTSADRDNGCSDYDGGGAAITIDCSTAVDDNYQYCLYQSAG